MKTTYTIAAIAMFAVIMGMSAIAPAMAVPKGNSGNADTEVCHFFAVYQTEIVDGVEVLILVDGEPVLDEDLSSWGVLYVSSQGAAKGHTNHGDETNLENEELTWCVTNQDGKVVDPDL
jgi:hypothetical protein